MAPSAKPPPAPWWVIVFPMALELIAFARHKPPKWRAKDEPAYFGGPEARIRRYVVGNNLGHMLSLNFSCEPDVKTAQKRVSDFIRALKKRKGVKFPYLWVLSRGVDGTQRLHAHVLLGREFSKKEIHDINARWEHGRYGKPVERRQTTSLRSLAGYVAAQRLKEAGRSYHTARGFQPQWLIMCGRRTVARREPHRRTRPVYSGGYVDHEAALAAAINAPGQTWRPLPPGEYRLFYSNEITGWEGLPFVLALFDRPFIAATEASLKQRDRNASRRQRRRDAAEEARGADESEKGRPDRAAARPARRSRSMDGRHRRRHSARSASSRMRVSSRSSRRDGY